MVKSPDNAKNFVFPFLHWFLIKVGLISLSLRNCRHNNRKFSLAIFWPLIEKKPVLSVPGYIVLLQEGNRIWMVGLPPLVQQFQNLFSQSMLCCQTEFVLILRPTLDINKNSNSGLLNFLSALTHAIIIWLLSLRNIHARLERFKVFLQRSYSLGKPLRWLMLSWCFTCWSWNNSIIQQLRTNEHQSFLPFM